MTIQGADRVFFEQMLDFLDEHSARCEFPTTEGKVYCMMTVRDLLMYSKSERPLWYDTLLDNDSVFMRLSDIMAQRVAAAK